jgi:predicted site-specific integrase-resolvase
MEQHGVSYSTASRWIDSGRQSELEARHVDRARLREECKASGVSLARAHSRKWEGFPREALALAPKRVSK